jgi:hypothetical protein
MRGVLLIRADPGLRAQEVFVFFLKPLITQAGFTPRVVVWSALLGVIPLLGMAFWGIPVAEEEPSRPLPGFLRQTAIAAEP